MIGPRHVVYRFGDCRIEFRARTSPRGRLDLGGDDLATPTRDRKLRREQPDHSSERRARLIDQMELQLEEPEIAAT